MVTPDVMNVGSKEEVSCQSWCADPALHHCMRSTSCGAYIATLHPFSRVDSTCPLSIMSVLKAVQAAMERLAPLRLAEKWDNVRAMKLDGPLRSLTSRRSGCCWVSTACSCDVRPDADLRRWRRVADLPARRLERSPHNRVCASRRQRHVADGRPA
jgi:hypothetical protein